MDEEGLFEERKKRARHRYVTGVIETARSESRILTVGVRARQ